MAYYRNIKLKQFLILGERYLLDPKNIGPNLLLADFLLNSNNEKNHYLTKNKDDDESIQKNLKDLVKLLSLEVFALFQKAEADFNIEKGDYDFIKSKKIHFLEYKDYQQDVDLINMEEVESVDLDEIQDECEQFEGVFMTDFLFKKSN